MMGLGTPARCRGCGAQLRALEHVYCGKRGCSTAARADAEARVRAMSEDERIIRARNALVAKAKRAIEDPIAFFELVMKDEATQKHVIVPPHQRVVLSFVRHPAHDKTVLILPIGHGKTTTCAGLGLWLLCRNARMRGLIASATQQQAKKPLALIRQTIESSVELRLINSNLVPSRRSGEPWSDTAITVDRPIGIRDPSFAAYGIDSDAIQGSRIDYALVDDLLNGENTESPEQRERTYQKFFQQVSNRIEPNALSRLIIINTTWHPHDYANRLAAIWPTLRMSAEGGIWVGNADADWDCEELLPTGEFDDTGAEKFILAAHEHQPTATLWPARYNREQLEAEREKYEAAPGMFNRFFLSDPNDDTTALCKKEFVTKCKAQAALLGVHALLPHYDETMGNWFTFTGVDLAVTPDKKGGQTAFFTFAVRSEDGFYQILDIDIGNWDAMTIIQKLLLKIRTFRSFAAVENNGTQEFLIQIARSMDIELPIRSHNTTAQGKAHPWQGVAAIFYEMGKGKWLIPSQKDGRTSRPVEKFVEACLGYTPTRHTADILMASFVARALAFKLGAMVAGPSSMGTPGRSQLTQERRAMMR